jgi:hypothetical protein
MQEKKRDEQYEGNYCSKESEREYPRHIHRLEMKSEEDRRGREVFQNTVTLVAHETLYERSNTVTGTISSTRGERKSPFSSGDI